MKGQRINQTFRSVAGSALVGPGLFILFGNLVCAATAISQYLNRTGEEGLSVLPSVIVAASVDQHWVMQALVHLFWPLLLVVAGAVLLRENATDEFKVMSGSQAFEGVRVSGRFMK
jgi:hypothetical protein